MIPNVLSIAGSDPSGGAGIQADLKTFAALGCYGMAAITALTAQNTLGVRGIHVPPAGFVAECVNAITDDVDVHAIKIGMVSTPEIARAVAAALGRSRAAPVVLDPVLVATSGDSLGAPGLVEAIRSSLFPLAALVTPNTSEAARFAGTGEPTDIAGLIDLAHILRAQGARTVLVKGGHLSGTQSPDVLLDAAGAHIFRAPRVATTNTHGTGCTLSAAIAAYLALGLDLRGAVAAAKDYLGGTLRGADALRVGQGAGPVDHGFAQRGTG